MILIPVFLGICSALFGALANLIAWQAMGFTTARHFVSFTFAIMFLLLLPLAPFYFDLQWGALGLSLVLCVAIIDGVANYFYFRSFEVNDVSTASVLLSLSPFFTLLLQPIVQSENAILKGHYLISVLLIAGGIVLLNLRFPTDPRNFLLNLNSKGATGYRVKLMVPLVAAFLFGSNIYLTKELLTRDITNPYTFYLIRSGIIAIFTAVLLHPNLSWVNRRTLQITVGRSILVIAQWLLMLYALESGHPALVKAISDSSPLFVMMLAVIFFGQRMTRRLVLGSGCILVGLGLLVW